MNENLTVSEVLNLAADHLQAYGWRNDGGGWFATQGQPACAEGAIHAVSTSLAEGKSAKRAVETYLNLPGFDRSRWDGKAPLFLWGWNDTAQDAAAVIAVLRAAAVVEAAHETEHAEVSA